MLLDFPEDMFELRPGEPQMYGDFPELRAGVDYFKSLVSREEWIERRNAVAKLFYQSLTGENSDASGKGRYYELADTMAWYLFLGEAFTDHPQNYEVFYGCRVVPILAAIGRNIEYLNKIKGFKEKAQALMGASKAQPNGGLFEMLVALAYARDGADVAFRPEQPGIKKSHDIDVIIDGTQWAVECKRMDGGEYAEFERQRMRELWKQPCLEIIQTGRSIYCKLEFIVAMETIPDNYLKEIAANFLKSGKTSHLWNDNYVYGVIGDLDLNPIQESLKKGYLLYPGPVYHKLLTGTYIRYDNLNIVHKVKFAPNPHFIDEIDQAVVARWRSLSEVAIDRKARDIRRKLVSATDQLPDDMPGVIHIGLEAIGDDEIERRRYEKIMQTISDFSFGKKDIRYFYWYYFAPEASPDETWAVDETFQWRGVHPTDMPLKEMSLIMPPDAKTREGFHWDGKSHD